MTWRKGMKAVCIASGKWVKIPGDTSTRCPGPAKGEIVTVIEVNYGSEYNYTGIFLRFAEWPEDTLGYWHECFRPLVERKTDISIFTRMLTDNKVPVDA